jgi:hypothetical protein
MEHSHLIHPPRGTRFCTTGGLELVCVQERSILCLLDIDIIPRTSADVPWTVGDSVICLTAYVWDNSFRCYRSQILVTAEEIWDLFFKDEAVYTPRPEEYIRHEATSHAYRAEPHFLGGPIYISEHGDSKRALWVRFQTTFSVSKREG